MSEVIDKLVKITDSSEEKSYLIGLERGRIWAEDEADYFELREWSELEAREFERFVLPGNEERHFHVLRTETPLEWHAYIRGWLEGVKEVYRRY